MIVLDLEDSWHAMGRRVLVAALLTGCLVVGSFVWREVVDPVPAPVQIVECGR
jgi:hypothetical protein